MANSEETMRAVMWEGKPYHVAVKSIPKAKIIEEEDAIVRVTTAGLCGTELHIYHGIFGGTEVPYSLGHEAVGIITEVGPAVEHFKVGDRVVIPGSPDPDVLVVNPELVPMHYAAYGTGNVLGPTLGGCQAEYVRVPIADESLVKIEDADASDEEYLFLTDIFATAWAGLDYSGFEAGDTVAVFGAGPVGLLTAYCAILRGAAKVYSVDHVQERLFKAASIGAIPIDFTKGEPSAQILALEPNGVQRCVDDVGQECLNGKLKNEQNYVLVQAIKCLSFQGGFGAIGGFFGQPDSEGVPNGDSMSPELMFPTALWFTKSITMRGGPVEILSYQKKLNALIKHERVNLGFIISGIYDIEDAPEAYRRFDKRLETKVLFKFRWNEKGARAIRNGTGSTNGASN